MESWFFADPEGLATYYGRDFHPDRLPHRSNLEEEPKADVSSKIAAPTRDTKKGSYSEANKSKIKHAGKILECISAEKVAKRCPRFATFTSWLQERIAEY